MEGTTKNRMLYELSLTEGWKEVLLPMLSRDKSFTNTLVLGPPKREVEGSGLDFKIKDMGAYRYAHGMTVEATKVINEVQNSSTKHLKEEGDK